MKYFESISFILEIIFLILIITLGILYSLNIIKDEKSWLNSGKAYKIIIEIIIRVAIFLALIYWGYVSLLPRIIDIPKFSLRLKRQPKRISSLVQVHQGYSLRILASGLRDVMRKLKQHYR